MTACELQTWWVMQHVPVRPEATIPALKQMTARGTIDSRRMYTHNKLSSAPCIRAKLPEHLITTRSTGHLDEAVPLRNGLQPPGR
jgi:hypothetical protein